MSASPTRSDIAALNAITRVSDDQLKMLEIFVTRLIKWQKTSNLVAPSTLPQIWSRHIGDSLQLSRHVRDCSAVIDLGSGGGLPAIVVAIMNVKRPDFRIDLVESNQKKCAFLRSVCRELELPAKVWPVRIESYVKQHEPKHGSPPVITARALASLKNLLELSSPLLAEGTGLFHKGREFQSEIDACLDEWKFDHQVYQSGVEPDSVLLEVRNVSRR